MSLQRNSNLQRFFIRYDMLLQWLNLLDLITRHIGSEAKKGERAMKSDEIGN
jgi:hypothetical protein